MDIENRCCKVEEVEPIKDLLNDAQVYKAAHSKILPETKSNFVVVNTFLFQIHKSAHTHTHTHTHPHTHTQVSSRSSLIDPVPHSQGEGLNAPPADCPQSSVHTEGYSGDTSTALASDTTLQQNGYLDRGPVQADVLSSSDVRDSLSPVGSGLDGYSLSNLHTISPSHLHTLTPSHSHTLSILHLIQSCQLITIPPTQVPLKPVL